ncbi:hypothetical protein [Gilvimarinus polysaccharolyticus]|uniref:hypothetical protein n=1 Tax=Gilvimarinus polysaccharolyticus TaxID=863921 RepID=UPI0018DD2915|nr:hypothetical protein [Gilvimarinus polysaccharolyticus]
MLTSLLPLAASFISHYANLLGFVGIEAAGYWRLSRRGWGWDGMGMGMGMGMGDMQTTCEA